jgi:DNA-binding GntR family transcriptional regulator
VRTDTGHPRGEVPPFRTKALAAGEALREAIRHGEIAPGERIDVERFSESLGMSITPIREALRHLEAEGLVTSTPHRGVRVKEFSTDEASVLYDLRALLEGFAIRLSVPRLSSYEIEQLEKVTELHRHAVERDDRQAIDEYNRDWHQLAYSRAETPYMDEFITRLWNAFPWTTRWQGPERLERSVASHAQMLSAIKDRQVDIVEALLRAHILDGKDYVLRQLQNPPAE